MAISGGDGGFHFAYEDFGGRFDKLIPACAFYTPRYKYGRGGGILESLCPSVYLSVCSSVRVSNRVRSIPPEPLNYFFFLYTKLGIFVYFHEAMCQSGEKKKKNWFTIFNVKVTARAYIIKI